MRTPTRTASALVLWLAAAGLHACGDEPLATDEDGKTADVLDDLPPILEIPLVDLSTGDLAPADDAEVSGDGGPTPTACDEEPLGFLCPCEFNVQCESGYCIAVDDEVVAQRCTKTCIDSCPEGWSCKSIAGGGDPIFLCIPVIDNLCQPCFQHSDCEVPGDLCLPLDGGNYCGRSCAADPNVCPADFSCVDVDDGQGGATSKQCVPDNGSCLCGPDVDLMNDPEHCGTCGHACAFDNGVPGCQGGKCKLAGCEAGWVDLNGEADDGCEYACTVTSELDLPDDAGLDEDCDGVDGEVERAIFVAPGGQDNAAGTRAAPVRTITKGIQKATQGGKDHVYVAAGTYAGQIALVDGVSIYGGYSSDGQWVRNLSLHETIVTNDAVDDSGHIRVVMANGLTKPTVLSGLTVKAGNNPNPGGSSYGVWLRKVTQAMVLNRLNVTAGNGGAGLGGGHGGKGDDGAVGQPGGSVITCDCNCNEFNTYGGKGGAIGASTCSSGVGNGGKGADGACGSDSGKAGSPSPDGTAGGSAGSKGSDGASGAAGVHGAGGGAGGSVNADGLWIGEAGEPGTAGKDGHGGGGGGSGGGNSGGIFCASWGAGGGGGGGAGCGGTPGKGGGAGGASIAVFIMDGKPVLKDLSLSHKTGGMGGPGGMGGAGGLGKTGGPGGTTQKGSSFDCGPQGGAGGPGGAGGNGGAGGHGGGGAGGVAFGLYVAGSSDPLCSNVSFQPLGTGGLGGIGGDANGNKGMKGLSGNLNTATPACVVPLN